MIATTSPAETENETPRSTSNAFTRRRQKRLPQIALRVDPLRLMAVDFPGLNLVWSACLPRTGTL